MNKFLFSFLLIAIVSVVSIMSVSATAPQIGDIIAIAVKSDIQASIDYTTISSYNIGGHTYIEAELLRNYGFSVEWNDETRTLSISRIKGETPIFTRDMWFEHKADIEDIGMKYNVYFTDIKTYLEGKEVNACNIGGRTLMRIDALSACGALSWNEHNRSVDIYVYEYELKQLFEKTPDKAGEFRQNGLDGDLWANGYLGQMDLSTGNPNGIGLRKLGGWDTNSGRKIGRFNADLGFYDNDKLRQNEPVYRYENVTSTTGDSAAHTYTAVYVGAYGDVPTEYNSLGMKGMPPYIITNYAGINYSGVFGCKKGVYYAIGGSSEYGTSFRSWYDGDLTQVTIETSYDNQCRYKTFNEYYNNELVFSETLTYEGYDFSHNSPLTTNPIINSEWLYKQ